MLWSEALYVVIICMYSVFPLVSAVIFQTVSYDRRLPPDEYLKADYSVESGDEVHQSQIVYAAVMGLVYMVGIPVSSYMLLYKWKDDISKLQGLYKDILSKDNGKEKQEKQREYDEMLKKNPFLKGLSPLFKDYEKEYLYWEIPRFFVTLILCGLVTVTNFQDGSQIATSLLVSTVMLVAYANCNPYLMKDDDNLAQFCQASLSLAMAVGLLEKANNASTADDEFKGSSSFGTVLIACVTVNLFFGVGAVLYDGAHTLFPEHFAKFSRVHKSVSKSVETSVREISSHNNNSVRVQPMHLATGSFKEASRPLTLNASPLNGALISSSMQAAPAQVKAETFKEDSRPPMKALPTSVVSGLAGPRIFRSGCDTTVGNTLSGRSESAALENKPAKFVGKSTARKAEDLF